MSSAMTPYPSISSQNSRGKEAKVVGLDLPPFLDWGMIDVVAGAGLEVII